MSDEVRDLVASSSDDEIEGLGPERTRYLLALSLLIDIVNAGGSVRVVDSEIVLSWPSWSDEGGRGRVQKALRSLRTSRPLTSLEWNRVRPMLAPRLKAEELEAVLQEGHFWLEPVEQEHPNGAKYAQAFVLALQHWSMPYRTREGRSRRFVVVGSHPLVCPNPVVAGIIEIGDDAPFTVQRDALLRLRVEEFVAWVNRQPDKRDLARNIGERLRRMRLALRGPDGVNLDASYPEVLRDEDRLFELASGRSRSHLNLAHKKQLAYLLRFAHGEAAFSQIADGVEVAASSRSLREGVRAMHDLTIPRVHMEVTVCGAVPPFSMALGGKLVVGFLGHPIIVSLTKGEAGAIVQSLFDPDCLAKELPGYGLLGLTTKGLYPGHSALYNRALIPGMEHAIHLRKIGDTKGETANLLSRETGRLAQAVHDSSQGRDVSRTFGTGGAKRQRTIESAILSLGLPGRFAHSGITRPVYAATFVEDVADVIWRASKPKWLIDRNAPSEVYSEAATALWRSRWGQSAGQRLKVGPPFIPGLEEELRE